MIDVATLLRFKLSLRWLLVWTACAPLMLATTAGVFGHDLQVVFCFDFLLVTALLIYVMVVDAPRSKTTES